MSERLWGPAPPDERTRRTVAFLGVYARAMGGVGEPPNIDALPPDEHRRMRSFLNRADSQATAYHLPSASTRRAVSLLAGTSADVPRSLGNEDPNTLRLQAVRQQFVVEEDEAMIRRTDQGEQ